MNQTISAICSIPAAISRDMRVWAKRRKREQRFRRMQATSQLNPVDHLQFVFGFKNHPSRIQTGNIPGLSALRPVKSKDGE